jgi:hypothetical protein
MAANDYTRTINITPLSTSYTWSTPPSWITITRQGNTNSWTITIAPNNGASRNATLSVNHSNGVTTDSIEVIQEAGYSSGSGGGAGIPTATPNPPTATPSPTSGSGGGAGVATTWSITGTNFFGTGTISYINYAGNFTQTTVNYNQSISICARAITNQSGVSAINTNNMCYS